MRLEDLDKIDRQIIGLLQVDGRLSNADLAERVHLSQSACLRRLRRLDESGLVAGYAMILDPKAAGYSGLAFVFVSLDQQGRSALDKFERAVAKHSEILGCYLLAGQADYLLHVPYRDSDDLERIHGDIITRLPGVVRVQSTLCLRTVKKTSALPV